MKRSGAGGFAVLLVVGALLVALSLVPWRQSRALEALAELDRVDRELTLVRAEAERYRTEVRRLESRQHVVEEARERLGMRMPSADEVVILDPGSDDPGEGPGLPEEEGR